MVVQRGRGVDQSAVEKSLFTFRVFCEVGKGHGDATTSEFRWIYPRQRVAAGAKFFPDNLATGFVDGSKAPLVKLGEQCRFSTPRAPGQYDCTTHATPFIWWAIAKLPVEQSRSSVPQHDPAQHAVPALQEQGVSQRTGCDRPIHGMAA